MRRTFFQSLEIFVIAAFLGGGGSARADDFFAKAESAYKAGKFAEAAAAYEKILDGGQFAPELFFNLGNSFFKQGELGAAVLNYRRAWMLAPRDADIKANLRFAMAKANAAGPDLSLPSRALLKISEAEWAAVAVAAYWSAAGLFVAFIFRRNSAALLKAALAMAVLASIATTGIFQWRALRSEPELVLTEQAQAMWGPMAESTPHFALPEGSIVRELDRAGDWAHVESGAESGWIRAKSCERVYPWKNIERR